MKENNELKLGLTREDVERRDEEKGIEGLLQAMGDADADAAAIAASKEGQIMARRMAVMAMPEDSRESREFWEQTEKGLKKEIHGEGLNKWASYIPLAAGSDPARRFPLIFCLHGAHNSKGEPLNLWDVSRDLFTDRNGEVSLQESMWPYVADIQRDFAARVAWASAESFEEGEHAPTVSVEEGLNLSVQAGQEIAIHAKASSPDGAAVQTTFRVYADASAVWAADVLLDAQDNTAVLRISTTAVTGDQLHVIVKAQAEGHHRLVHYQQMIITVE